MKQIGEKVLHKGSWLTLKERSYLNDEGDVIKWEMIEREGFPDSLVVIARMVPSNRYCLIKQYRFAINGYVLGFPAGIAENNIEHALKELKEETGYTGKIVSVSPALKTSTGIMDSNTNIVIAEIDETDPVNFDPEPELEPTEKIEVILLKRDEVKPFLLEEQSRGTAIGAGVWGVFCLQDLLL